MSDALMMEIKLDEQTLLLPVGTTLAQVLERLQLAPASLATALNGQFVARESRAATRLVHADQVLLFKPIVGG
ncbi:sulfur carrier protein ThiS [Roseateles sp. GG27B]